jgi:AraC-like DNA-binding protein
VYAAFERPGLFREDGWHAPAGSLGSLARNRHASKDIESVGQPLEPNWPARPPPQSPRGEAVLSREKDMDSLTKRIKPNRSKINMHEAWELDHWTRELGVSRSELQRVVNKVGNSAAEMRKELTRKTKS